MKLIIDIMGWLGSIQILTGYFLISTNKIHAASTLYLALNITGSAFLVVNTLHYKTYPVTMLNVIWFIIGLYALVKIIRAR